MRCLLTIGLLCGIALMAGGCNLIGVVALATPPAVIQPKYVGLAGQSVSVMVWAERGISIDFPGISLDTTSAVQGKLQGSRAKELAGATFPHKPASLVRYQNDHPEIAGTDMSDVVPRLGITRLVYIEIEEFDTRAASAELFRGHMNVTMRIYEVIDGQGKMVFEENNITTVFPPKVPDDGLPAGDDYKFYLGTIDAISTEILLRLTPYEDPNL